LPVGERLYFIRPARRLLIDPVLSKKEFSSRSKVDIGIVSKDETGKRGVADLSISVFKAGDGLSRQDADISSYIWMVSDLRGNIESPSFYFGNTSPEADEAIDNLMLTHGWRKFVWQQVLQNVTPQFDYVPELQHHIIEAKITNANTGLPATGIITYLSVPGQRVQLYASKSDSSGRLRFYTRDLYGPSEILLQTDSSHKSNYRIELTSPFSQKNSTKRLSRFDLPATTKVPLTEENIGVQVQNLFKSEKLNRFYSPVVDSNAFYGRPDNSYQLDDYVRFSTMEEVLREYVVEVLVRRQKENFRLMMSTGVETKIFMDNPTTLFNGVPVFETNKVLQYDPLKIRKIEVVRRRYFYGPLIMNGIVNFTTYEPDPVMISGLDAVVFEYDGLQFAREFYSPVYDTPQQLSNRIPDFRSQLFWSHNLKTDLNGTGKVNFYTSDQKGEYIVVVQGMNVDGRVGEQFARFTVK
jgi:hypothetical protein